MVAVPEVFVRRTKSVAIAYQIAMPVKVLERDALRLWGAVICGQFDVPVALTANPLASIGDPDTCVFLPGQGAVYFETYGNNDVYILGLPVGTPVAISTSVKSPKYQIQQARSMRTATRIETTCGNVDLVFDSGSALFLPEDQARRRVMAKGDSVFGALTTAAAAVAFDFMPIAPFFPGYAVIEGTEELRFIDFGTGPANVGFVQDREVSAT